MRGNQGYDDPSILCLGSIPACAGEPPTDIQFSATIWVYPRVCGGTPVPPFPHSRHRVYPRVCGGTPRVLFPKSIVAGLSPRVRGNREHAKGRIPGAGSIPACAGEPWLGESDEDVSGSIPACAGEPARISGYSSRARVCPRVCGGTVDPGVIVTLASGLSPRVRGNPLCRLHRWFRAGSIPACAGEPLPPGWGQWLTRVYPRVCGGTDAAAVSYLKNTGLSPRVRGNLEKTVAWREGEGSIPACAGEPAGLVSSLAIGGVYPRVCGGTCLWYLPWCASHGLSPRVRGNLRREHGRCIGKGSIPACAGEPRCQSQ